MASTYSTSLKIQLMGNGEDSGTWGSITNTNWNLMEQAVAGVQTITMANANYTLTDLNGVSDEARNMVLVVNGTNSAIRQIIAPLANKFYIVSNQTVGGYAITIGGASGSIITVPQASTVQVYCDGTNFYSAQTSSAGNFNVNGNLTVNGTSTLTGNTTIGGTLQVLGATASTNAFNCTTIQSVTGNFSGNLASLGSVSGASGIFGAVSGTTGTFTGAVSGTTGTFSGAVSGTTGTFSGAVSGASGAFGAVTGTTGTFSGTVTGSSFSGAGTGLTGTANSLSIGGNANTATGPASGGTFITSSNIGSQSVYYATNAGTATAATYLLAFPSGGNNIYLGWNGQVQLKVGNTNFGGDWPINLAGNVINAAGRGPGIYTYGNPVYAFSRANNYLEVITDIGSVGVTYFPSDENKKDNIAPATAAALPIVDAIKTIEYDWKPESGQEGHVAVGVSAQQLRTVNPDFVAELSDGGLMVKDNVIFPYLIKAIQELQAEVNALKAK